VAGMIRSNEKFSNLIGIRSHDFPGCSTVPQPTELPHAPILDINTYKSQAAQRRTPREKELRLKFVAHVFTNFGKTEISYVLFSSALRHNFSSLDVCVGTTVSSGATSLLVHLDNMNGVVLK
jgi:hypothetical protein